MPAATASPTPALNPLAQVIQLSLYGLPLTLALVSPPAIAEQAGGTAPQAHYLVEATTLDQVEVRGTRSDYSVDGIHSATRTDTPLRDIPQSITVVTDVLIRDQAMQNMADVVRYVPGVQMAQGEGHRDAPILRGNMTTADFFLNGVRDDVQYYRDLYNVERVEVLKGPSGMIFGRGATGGLINRVTRQANWRDARRIGVTIGAWDNFRITGDYDQALNDAAAFRVTGMYETSGSYRDFTDLERWAINPTMTFRPGEASTVELGYEHFADDRVTDRGVPSMLPAANKPLPADASTFFGNPELSTTWARVDALSGSVSHEFGRDARLVNTTRLADYDKYYQNVYPSGFVAPTGQVAISGYGALTNRRNVINQTDLTYAAQTGSVHHEVLAGLELARQETANFRQTAYFPDVAESATTAFVTLPETIYRGVVEFRQSSTDADNDSVARTAGLYVQDQIAFSDKWQLLAGVRFDRFDIRLRNHRNDITTSKADCLWSPRLGLIHKPRDTMSVYASYSVSQVPRAGEQLASLTPSNRNLAPERFINSEIGFKWDPSPRLALTAALYRLDRTNLAVVDPNAPAQSILVDGQRMQGLELGLSGNLGEAWRVMAGYAYQDSEVRTPGPQDGNRVGQVPQNSLSVWNRYDFTPKWGAGLGVIHRDEVFVASDNAVVLPDFTRVDAAVYYAASEKLRLQLNIENLLDEGYYASAHSNNNIMPGAPRTVRLGIDWRF
jgi:catecholate siderophore receptor